MARKAMVTRTILSTKVTALCTDIVANEMVEKEITLPQTYKDNNAILKVLEKTFNTDTLKAVRINKVEVEEKLYGMDEQKFIENAVVLPPPCQQRRGHRNRRRSGNP